MTEILHHNQRLSGPPQQGEWHSLTLVKASPVPIALMSQPTVHLWCGWRYTLGGASSSGAGGISVQPQPETQLHQQPPLGITVAAREKSTYF